MRGPAPRPARFPAPGVRTALPALPPRCPARGSPRLGADRGRRVRASLARRGCGGAGGAGAVVFERRSPEQRRWGGGEGEGREPGRPEGGGGAGGGFGGAGFGARAGTPPRAVAGRGWGPRGRRGEKQAGRRRTQSFLMSHKCGRTKPTRPDPRPNCRRVPPRARKSRGPAPPPLRLRPGPGREQQRGAARGKGGGIVTSPPGPPGSF